MNSEAMQGDHYDFEFRCACGEGMEYYSWFAGTPVMCPRCRLPILVPKERGEQATDLKIDIRTERLQIQPAKPSEWKVILPITSDPQNYRYEISFPETERSLRRRLRQTRFPRGFAKCYSLSLLVRRLEDSEPLGMIYFHMEPNYPAGTLGFKIHHPFQSQGYGSEAVMAFTRFCVYTMNLHRIQAMCDVENAACIAVLKKAGFLEEGRFEDYIHHIERGWINCHMFARVSND